MGWRLLAIHPPEDRARDQAPTCFTFLPAKGDNPTRVIVGHYYGASLFELTPAGVKRSPVLVRWKSGMP